MEPNETILKNDMIHGFEVMCDVHEAVESFSMFFYSSSSNVYSTL